MLLSNYSFGFRLGDQMQFNEPFNKQTKEAVSE